MHLHLIRFVFIAGLSLCASAVNAQTVNFDMTGKILPGICRFDIADVDLGTFYATEFTSIGTTTPTVTVRLSATGCDPLITEIHMYVTGTPDAADSKYFRGIAGIGIELFTYEGQTPIRPTGDSISYNASAGATNYLLNARFRQTATVVASGNVRSAVTIQLSYN